MLMILLLILVLASASNPLAMPRSTVEYELIHRTDSTTEITGSIIMTCRSSTTAENIPVSEVKFWLNRTNGCDVSLRERLDISVTEVNNGYGIKFNLTHDLDGYYTCGRCISGGVLESNKKTFISLQTLIKMPDTGITRSYTAYSGDRVVLPCPMQPGALLQYYSVIWTKDSNEIANSQNSVTTNGKYGIGGSTYSLIIDPVDANDTSPSYQCQMYVHNPTTDTKQQLHYYPQTVSDVSLQLTVIKHNEDPLLRIMESCMNFCHSIKFLYKSPPISNETCYNH